MDGLPEYARVGFFLEGDADPQIVVREVIDESHYWLDRVDPPSGWKTGQWNEFTWPTRLVLSELAAMEKTPSLYKLGVVVRANGDSEGGTVEQVIPAWLYSSAPVLDAKDYVFVILVSQDLVVGVELDSGRAARQVLEPKKLRPARLPFRVVVPATSLEEGENRLRLAGYHQATKNKVELEIVFHHQTRMPPTLSRRVQR